MIVWPTKEWPAANMNCWMRKSLFRQRCHSALYWHPSSSSRMFINGLINWVASINPAAQWLMALQFSTTYIFDWVLRAGTKRRWLAEIEKYKWQLVDSWLDPIELASWSDPMELLSWSDPMGLTSWLDPMDHKLSSWSADHWLPPIESRDRSPIDDKTVEILSLLSIVFCLPLFSKINQIN